MKNGRTRTNHFEANDQTGDTFGAQGKKQLILNSIVDAFCNINPPGFSSCLNGSDLAPTGFTPMFFRTCHDYDPDKNRRAFFLSLSTPADHRAVSERDFRGGLFDLDGPVFPAADQACHGEGLLDDPVTVFFARAVFVVAACFVGHEEQPPVKELDLVDPGVIICRTDSLPGNPGGIIEDFLVCR
jgi:hypothetical protein